MQSLSTPFLEGLLTGLGLIIAIGAQNAFVLSQGLTRQYNILIATICATSDIVLIVVGVLGMGLLISQNQVLLFAAALGGAIFLSIYSLRALRSALSAEALDAGQRAMPNARAAIMTTLAITLLNPHVYLDTVVLLGAIGGRYPANMQTWFIAGASVASIAWFFTLSLGARKLAHVFTSPVAWRILDLFVSFVMAVIAYNLWRQVFLLLPQL